MDKRLTSQISFMNLSKPGKAVHFSESRNLDDNDDNDELQIQPEKVRSRHSSRAAMFGGGVGTVRDAALAEAHPFIVFPWARGYKVFWSFTVVAAIFTLFFETFMVAFEEPGLAPYNNGSAAVECVIMAVYTLDIVVNFNLAYYNHREELIYDRKEIAKHYVRTTLWKDILGVFPFYAVLLAITGEMGSDSQVSQYLSLVRLVRMIVLHRLKLLFEILQFNSKISLSFLTILRNFFFTFVWVHFWACVMYFIAKRYDFDPDQTAIGSAVPGVAIAERYILVLYYTIVTFTTVGYGDFSPVNPAEQVFNMVYMFLNILFMAWIIGSITLLVVKSDQRTGAYRELLSTVDNYARLNNFKPHLRKRLKTQLKLNFNNQDVSDEHVLSHFPSSIRRRILRRLYMSSLIKTALLEGVRVQFLDELLGSCKVEIFGPGEELLQRGCIATDLYLLVGGHVELINYLNEPHSSEDNSRSNGSTYHSSIGDNEMNRSRSGSIQRIGPGDFVNEISFFTSTPQIDTIRTAAICKTLTISRSAYKMISDDHPGTAMKILRNLLTKVEMIADQLDFDQRVNLPKSLPVLQAGSVYDMSGKADDDSLCRDVNHAIVSIQTENTLSTVRDLVRMHMEKVNDDHTTRFLFAASRGDLKVITLMCDQGFDPNEADYDQRTALMIAAVQGNTGIVKKLFSYEGINANKTDIHGNSALYEAVKCGHDSVIDVLLEHDASLCMDDNIAASTLCQVVSTGDISKMRRLLKAKIQVNASDYDMRCASHIAAAEGNVVALKLLVDHGADLGVRDRWGNSVFDEAKRSKSGQLLDYLKSFSDL